MRVAALALALATAFLAGCGGHGMAAQANGEAAKPAARVLADARAAATSASSVHVSGHIASGGTAITIDASMARGNGAEGSATIDGLSFDLVRIGGAVYIKGSDAFYKHFAGAVIAQLVHGRWIKASVDQPRFRSFAPLTRISAIFAEIASHHGKLANEGKTTYQGQQVVEIRDTSDKSRLYVAATGKPYPVAIVGGAAGRSGAITFGDWNKPVSLSAPKGAIDTSQLGG